MLKGYPFTLGLSLALVTMTVFAPILKLQTLARRWSSQHVPMLVDAEDYEVVVGEIQAALRAGGWPTERRPAGWLLRVPTKLLTRLAGGSLQNLVAERLITLRSDRLEAMLHPSDLVLQGRTADVIHARAVLTERLVFSKAHLTWTKEGNELEDQIRRIGQAVEAAAAPGRALDRLRAIEEQIERIDLPYEEWEVLFRAKLLVEVTARRTGSPEQADGWTRRTLLPLGVALVRQTLESPRIREAVDRFVVSLLDRGRPERADAMAGPSDHARWREAA
jgi:hypothetical protein